MLDTRTDRYFGGGRADKMISHWVKDVSDAKFFRVKEDINAVLTQLKQRNEEYGPNNIESNPIIGPNVPPYSDDAYVAKQVLVTKKELVVAHD